MVYHGFVAPSGDPHPGVKLTSAAIATTVPPVVIAHVPQTGPALNNRMGPRLVADTIQHNIRHSAYISP